MVLFLATGGGGEGENEVAIKNGEEEIIDLCSAELESDSEVVADVDVIVQYPTNRPGRIAVKKVDIETLNPGRFLNDIIIDFYMKYLYNEHLDPSYQPNIHIHNHNLYLNNPTLISASQDCSHTRSFTS